MSGEAEIRPASRRLIAFLPLLVFAALAALFLFRLDGGGDPSKVPSALIGRSVPDFDLPGVEGLERDGQPVPGLSDAALKRGRVSVVNVWASWCAPCREEHPLLMKLAADPGIDLYGLNYKDAADNARRFLGLHGNPFRAVGADARGRTGIDWGVYGVPETFVVDGAGRIVFKHVGPLSEKSIADRLMPAIAAAAKP